jgi:hypothetical protein
MRPAVFRFARKSLPLLLLILAPAGAFEVKYDVAGNLVERFGTHVIQVGQGFGSYGAEAWVEHRDQTFDEDYAVGGGKAAERENRGTAFGLSFYAKPLRMRYAENLRFSIYFRYMELETAYRSVDGAVDFRQHVEANALGGGLAYHQRLWKVLFAEPYLKCGLGRFRTKAEGVFDEPGRYSDYTHAWDPDFRTGLFLGLEF